MGGREIETSDASPAGGRERIEAGEDETAVRRRPQATTPSVLPQQSSETSPATSQPQNADGTGDVVPAPAGTRGPRRRDSMACIVPNCPIRLSDEGQSSVRLRACLGHRNALVVDMLDGRKGRFCQQCAKLQPIEDFDGDRRGCRKRLQRLQYRRRTKALARKVPRGSTSLEESEAADGSREGPPMPVSRGEDSGAQHELYAEKKLPSLRSNMPTWQGPDGGIPYGSDDEQKRKAAKLNPDGREMHLTSSPSRSYRQPIIQDPGPMESRHNNSHPYYRPQPGYGASPLDEVSRGSKGSDYGLFHEMQRSLWHVSTSHGKPQYIVTMMMHGRAGPYQDVPQSELIEALSGYHEVEPAIIEINVCQDVMRTSVIFVMKNEEAYLKSLDTFPERFLEGIADQKDQPWCKHDTDVLLPDMAIQIREEGDHVVTSGRCPASGRQSQHSARGHGDTPSTSGFIDRGERDVRQIAPSRSMTAAAAPSMAYPPPFGGPQKSPGSSKSLMDMEYVHHPSPRRAGLPPYMAMRSSQQHELQPSDIGRDMQLHRDMGIGRHGHQHQVPEPAHMDRKVSGHQSKPPLQMDMRHQRQPEYAQVLDMYNRGLREDRYHQVAAIAEMGMRQPPRHYYQYEPELVRRHQQAIAPESVPGAEAAPWRHGHHHDVSPRRREEQPHGMPNYCDRER